MSLWSFKRTDSPCAAAPPGLGPHMRRVVRDTARAGPAGLLCARCKLPSHVRILPLVVEAVVFFDARAVAYDAFHTTALAWEEDRRPESERPAPHVVVTWTGGDYNIKTGDVGKHRVLAWAGEPERPAFKRRRV